MRYAASDVLGSKRPCGAAAGRMSTPAKQHGGLGPIRTLSKMAVAAARLHRTGRSCIAQHLHEFVDLLPDEVDQLTGTYPRHRMFLRQATNRSMEAIMTSRKDRVEERAKQVKKEEGVSHGRNPENMDPETLEDEDAETVRANKEMKRKVAGSSDDSQVRIPGERRPPD